MTCISHSIEHVVCCVLLFWFLFFPVSVLEKVKVRKVWKKGRGVPCIVYIGCFCTFLSFCFLVSVFCFELLESSLFSFTLVRMVFSFCFCCHRIFSHEEIFCHRVTESFWSGKNIWNSFQKVLNSFQKLEQVLKSVATVLKSVDQVSSSSLQFCKSGQKHGHLVGKLSKTW